MRTTVTLDPDTDAAVRRLMRERGLTLTQAVNVAIRAGTRTRRRRFRTPTAYLGPPRIPVDHALRLAAEFDDEERIGNLVDAAIDESFGTVPDLSVPSRDE